MAMETNVNTALGYLKTEADAHFVDDRVFYEAYQAFLGALYVHECKKIDPTTGAGATALGTLEGQFRTAGYRSIINPHTEQP